MLWKGMSLPAKVLFTLEIEKKNVNISKFTPFNQMVVNNENGTYKIDSLTEMCIKKAITKSGKTNATISLEYGKYFAKIEADKVVITPR